MADRNMPTFKVGQLCGGDKIEKIYFQNKIHKYLIFKSDGCVKVNGKENLTDVEDLISEIKFLLEDEKNKKIKERYFNQMALSYNSYLSGDKNKSKKILENIIKNLENRKIIVKKIIYIGIFLIFVVIFSLISVLLAINIIKYQELKRLFYVGTFGVIGGFISLNLKLDKVEFKVSESNWSYIIVSIYKSVYSILAGVICYFLIKSNLLLGILEGTGESGKYFIYSISALAGFSETLLPNIFSKIENSKEESTQ